MVLKRKRLRERTDMTFEKKEFRERVNVEAVEAQVIVNSLCGGRVP
jgi:hypothetical protein